ncbi:hypothetical protein Hgul01_02127 [Herpetosiphon gulosus]|uniref:Uncharacterized protein n=1 Tax=Herpetosiphon gulosus TaxID=1973496 RepID=A0ABP9WYR3_9CHLR
MLEDQPNQFRIDFTQDPCRIGRAPVIKAGMAFPQLKQQLNLPAHPHQRPDFGRADQRARRIRKHHIPVRQCQGRCRRHAMLVLGMLANACPPLNGNRLRHPRDHQTSVHVLLLANDDRTIPRCHRAKLADKCGQRLRGVPRIGNVGVAGQTGNPKDPVLVVLGQALQMVKPAIGEQQTPRRQIALLERERPIGGPSVDQIGRGDRARAHIKLDATFERDSAARRCIPTAAPGAGERIGQAYHGRARWQRAGGWSGQRDAS